MKRKISICVAITAAVLLTASLSIYNRTSVPEDTQSAQASSDTENMEDAVVVNTDHAAVFLYVLKDCDGRVTVYLQESGDVFMETGIRTIDLPEQVQVRLTEGIGFLDEESLFDFLESYSS